MTETEIAQMNERVAVAMGWKPVTGIVNWQGTPRRDGGPDQHEWGSPDFYHDIRLAGEMMEWLRKRNKGIQMTDTQDAWAIVVGDAEADIYGRPLNECLCRAIDAIAKGRET